MHSHFEIMIEEIFWVGRRYDIMLTISLRTASQIDPTHSWR
jgi:hypothetical protein